MILRAILVGTAMFAALPAHAQTISGGVEAATDESRRGLSWSQGRGAASADAFVPLGAADLSVRAVTLRGSARHADADAVADVELGADREAGPFRLRAHVTGHLFVDARASMDFVEVGGSGSYSLGPVQLDAGAIYAPDQNAIGGDNLYLFARANAGIPTTPLTLSAAIGRTSGGTDEPLRAARLRPGGNYVDWRLGLEWNQAPFTLGLDYVGTDIGTRTSASPFADLANSTDRVIARARVSF